MHAVRKTPDAAAGSMLKRFNKIGIPEPSKPAIVKFIITELAKTKLKLISANNRYVSMMPIIDSNAPFNMQRRISFEITLLVFAFVISLFASARTVTVIA